MMAEAEGLVNTLENWTVVDKMILSTKTPEKKRIFGKGNFQTLTGMIHSGESEGLDQVLLTCELPDVSLQRGSGKQQESLLCSSMLSVWLLCLRWACLKTLAVLDERFRFFFFFFVFLTHFCLEGLWGSLGGQSVWQILSSPPHFPLQRQNQRSQASDLTGRDPSVKVPYTATCGWLVKCFSLIWWCLPISVKSHLVR